MRSSRYRDFIASGFDFADWVELAAPRAYAMVGTVGDMFPWKGFLETATEARRFYSLFDAQRGRKFAVVCCQFSVADADRADAESRYGRMRFRRMRRSR